MRLTMKDRKTVTKAMCDQYRKADKGGKVQVLTPFVVMTGYNRLYAAWLLRQHGRRVGIAPRVPDGAALAVRPPFDRGGTPRPCRLAVQMAGALPQTVRLGRGKH